MKCCAVLRETPNLWEMWCTEVPNRMAKGWKMMQSECKPVFCFLHFALNPFMWYAFLSPSLFFRCHSFELLLCLVYEMPNLCLHAQQPQILSAMFRFVSAFDWKRIYKMWKRAGWKSINRYTICQSGKCSTGFWSRVLLQIALVCMRWTNEWHNFISLLR